MRVWDEPVRQPHTNLPVPIIPLDIFACFVSFLHQSHFCKTIRKNVENSARLHGFKINVLLILPDCNTFLLCAERHTTFKKRFVHVVIEINNCKHVCAFINMKGYVYVGV